MSGRTARRRVVRWGAAAGAAGVVVLVAGCSGGDHSSGASAANGGAAAGQAPVAAPAERARAGGAPHASGKDAGTLPSGTLIVHGAAADRSIVYTADVSVQAADVAAQATKAVSIVTRAGGYLFGEQTSDSGGSGTDLTFKVPAPRFTGVLAQLQRLGRQLSTTETADDVTGEVVDLTSRVATAKASVARVRALLAEATGIGDVVDIEGELTQRESALESLEGKLRLLTDQVALSTIDLHLSARPAPPPPAPRHHGTSGFVGGLRHGWDAFVTAFTVCVTGLGAALPFVLTLGALAAAGWWLRRQLHARRSPAAPES